MDVDVVFCVEIFLNPQFIGAGADTTDGGFGRFFHHITQGTRQFNAAGSFHNGNLNRQHFTTDTGPSQSIDQPNHIFFRKVFAVEFARAEEFFEIFRSDAQFDLRVLYNSDRTLAANLRNLAL